MKQIKITSILLASASFLILFSGCSRYTQWVESVFNQGEELKRYTYIPRQYMRSAQVYQQFTTLGIFDVMWLHDEVREAYAKVYAQRNCLSEERYQSFLHSQFEENNNFIVFYMLVTVPDKEPKLQDKRTQWKIQLFVDGYCYHPVEIKKVELEWAYKMFYGPWFNNFKTVYKIKFNAVALDGTRIIQPGCTRAIHMALRRVGREEKLTWHLDPTGKVIRRDILNPNLLNYDLYTNVY